MGYDLTGQRFGRLTVMHKSNAKIQKKSSYIMWYCKCDCKNYIDVRSQDLKSGKTKSCGCLHKDIISTHKLPKNRLYKIWIDMRSRCRNKNLKCYKNYGGRGINVCEEWNEYKNFYEWSINNGYNTKLTIDRIDTNGNYEPANCRWITKREQENNKRNNIFDYFNGELITMSQFSEKTCQNFSRISYMYHKKKMSFDEINDYFTYHESRCIDTNNQFSSIYLSKKNNKRHSDLIKKIDRLIKNKIFNNKDVVPKFYKTSQNQYKPCYLLSSKVINFLNEGESYGK